MAKIRPIYEPDGIQKLTPYSRDLPPVLNFDLNCHVPGDVHLR